MASKCPVCGVAVKPENLVSHLKKVHPQATEEIEALKKEAKHEKADRPTGRGPASKWLFLAAFVVVVVVVTGIVLLPPSTGPPVGNPAPSFRLLDVDGQWIDFPDDYMDDVVVLDFFQAHCPGCQNNTRKTLVNVYNNYSQVKMISIDIDPTEDEAKIEWFKDRFVRPYTSDGGTWTFALDKSQASSSYWGQYTPTTYIVKEGEVFFKHPSGPGVPALTYAELSVQLNLALST